MVLPLGGRVGRCLFFLSFFNKRETNKLVIFWRAFFVYRRPSVHFHQLKQTKPSEKTEKPLILLES